MMSSVSETMSYAAVSAGVGVAAGTAVSMIMPALPLNTGDDADFVDVAIATAVQAALNGLAIVAASRFLKAEDDPTHGVLFTWALISAQPGMERRLKDLARTGGAAVAGRVREEVASSGASAAMDEY